MKYYKKAEILRQYYICITFKEKVLILEKKTYKIKKVRV